MKESIRLACNTVIMATVMVITAIQLQEVQANSERNLIQHSPQLIRLSTFTTEQ